MTQIPMTLTTERRKAWGLFDKNGTLVEVKLLSFRPFFNSFELSRNWSISKYDAAKYSIDEVNVSKGDRKFF